MYYYTLIVYYINYTLARLSVLYVEAKHRNTS